MAKLKEKDKTLEENNQKTTQELDNPIAKQDQMIVEKSEKKENQNNSSNSRSQDWSGDIKANVDELARILDVKSKDLVEEFYLNQIKKIMIRLQKVIVRYDMSEQDLDNFFFESAIYGLGGLTVAPVYLPTSVKRAKKAMNSKLNLCSIIDFPFGESSIKGKLSDIKESLKTEANSVAVAMPSMMLNKENLKEFKKQSKIICRAGKKRAGLVLNASDLTQEKFEQAMKVLAKTKIAFITLAFGDATLEEVKEKLLIINNCKIEKKIFVLANVSSVDAVVELFKLKVDSVLSPFADQIGRTLLQRFNLID